MTKLVMDIMQQDKVRHYLFSILQMLYWGIFGQFGILLFTPNFNDTWYAYDFFGMTLVVNSVVAATYSGSGNNTGVAYLVFIVIEPKPNRIDLLVLLIRMRERPTEVIKVQHLIFIGYLIN